MTYAEFIEMLTWIMRYNMAIDKLMVPQCVLELLDHAITQGIPFYECPKKQVFSWLDGIKRARANQRWAEGAMLREHLTIERRCIANLKYIFRESGLNEDDVMSFITASGI
jgi:hypothetical protein